jgi:hypothetical protein
MSVQKIEILRKRLQESFDLLLKKINEVTIGNPGQFPYGWRKAAKGRTVWRILEELITQNLEAHCAEFNLSEVITSDSEVSIYDFICKFVDDETPIYVNVKSAVLNGRINKDDISKGLGLKQFFEEDIDRHFFVATFFISFNDNMSIKIQNVAVFPLAWIPDIYVNPSNNGNLQSSKYKEIGDATKRTNKEFFKLFLEALELAKNKRLFKNRDN